MKSRNSSILQGYNKGLEISKGFKLSCYILSFLMAAYCISGYVYASDEFPDPTEFLVASNLTTNPDYLDASDILFKERGKKPVLKAEQKEPLLPAGIAIHKEQPCVLLQSEPGSVAIEGRVEKILEEGMDSFKDIIVPKEVLQKEDVATVDRQPTPASIERQLWKTRVTSPKEEKDEARRDELTRLIEQIRSIEFKDETEPEPLIIIEKPNTGKTFAADSNNILQKSIRDSKAVKEQTGTGDPQFLQVKTGSVVPEFLTDESLQLLDGLSKQPEQIGNPLGLADILYRSRQLHYAGIFYKQALKLAEEGKEEKKNIDWILFQGGNCLAEEDPEAALKIYRRLIKEYPGSPWKEVAEVREKLIGWYLKDKPKLLINPE